LTTTAVAFRPRVVDREGKGGGVVLVGFQDQGNLGMGYLAAALQDAGQSVDLIEFRDSPESIIERVVAADPVVVGLSLIFQYYLPDYRRLLARLRDAGVTAHMTMGGHYPSLCPDEVLTAVPELDSVALFEGERTLVELVSTLARGQDWRLVPGLAYRAGTRVIETAPRPLVEDLDELPWPYRPYPPEHVLGWPTLPLLGSRGCARRCSFCSIHTFYRGAPGRTVRVRAASRIVDEMEMLADERGVRIFLFQDDDFPMWGRRGKRWVHDLADEIDRRGLSRRSIWKISCRAEYVEPDLFERLRDAGLYLVYLGLESGSAEGLNVLNKQMTVETNLRAVEMLKELGLLVEYGFMLFDPSSTFESVRQNTQFLRKILADGSGGAVFCRMLPYGGTPIRDRLRDEGRLRGDVRNPDYDFLDLRLNRYHDLLNRAVAPWIHGEGLSHQLNWAWHEVFIIDRLVGALSGLDGYKEQLAALCRHSNDVLLDFVDDTAVAFERGDERALRSGRLVKPRADLGDALLALRNRFVGEHQDELLDAVAASETVRGPILAPQLF
jgi:anaerobic magnesium-protoporphyrin IX monomethyl ester cyclase